MQTLRKLLFFSASVFLFTVNSLPARPAAPSAPVFPAAATLLPGAPAPASPAAPSAPSAPVPAFPAAASLIPGAPAPVTLSPAEGSSPVLSAALCELAAWNAEGPERDSLLLRKAALLSEAGEPGRAFETVGRIPMMGRSPETRAELIRRKLVYSYEAGLMDDFCALLDEAQATGALLLLSTTATPEPTSVTPGSSSATLSPAEGSSPAAAPVTPDPSSVTPELPSVTLSPAEGSPRHRNEDIALILSVIPGLGNAYVGDWKNAGKNFLLGSGAIALGVGAYLSGLYIAAFAGGGMLLYSVLPKSTDQAVREAGEYNARALRDFYAPLYETLSRGLRP